MELSRFTPLDVINCYCSSRTRHFPPRGSGGRPGAGGGGGKVGAPPVAPPLPVAAARGGGGEGGRGGKEGTKETSFGPRFLLLGVGGLGGTPAGSPPGGRGAAAARARRGAVRRGRGEEAALLLPAPHADIHHLNRHTNIHTIYTQIFLYAVHTGGASCPAAARSHGPAAPEKAAETLFHPKKCIFRGAAAGVTRSAGRCRARPPRAPFPGRVPALPGQGEPGTAGEGGTEGGPRRPLAEEPPLPAAPARLADKQRNVI